jgi:GH24 family phage-related lysozyme (muramidase)
MTTDIVQQAIDLSCELLIKPFEGYHRRLPDGGCAAYPDPATGAEPWTIGYGTTGGITPQTIWTHEQATYALKRDCYKFALGVVNLSPDILNEPPRKLAALISFTYNCGLGNYRISTLRKRVNEGDWLGAQQEIKRWNKAAGRVLSGLTRRRNAESLMLV